MKVLSFGEIIWDIYPDKQYIGGAPLNFAAHISNCGLKSFLLSAVGNDENGVMAKERLENFGVDTRFVSTIKGKATGACFVSLDEKGVPQYNLMDDVAYDWIPLFQHKDLFFDAFAFGTLALRHENNRRVVSDILLSQSCKNVYCDLNLRTPFYSLDTINFCLNNSNILKLSEDELLKVSNILSICDKSDKEKARRIAQRFENMSIVIVTLGENGSFAYEKNSDSFFECGAVKVEPVSTVGAGDSFGAAFLSAYLQGNSIGYCLLNGAERSAFVVSHMEAVPIEMYNT